MSGKNEWYLCVVDEERRCGVPARRRCTPRASSSWSTLGLMQSDADERQMGRWAAVLDEHPPAVDEQSVTSQRGRRDVEMVGPIACTFRDAGSWI